MSSVALTFVGSGRALTPAGFSETSDRLGVDAPTLWALLHVETSGCGFLADRRPKILYERHVFHRLTNGGFDDGDISAGEPGGYGPLGPAQYDRLTRAMALDSAAALQSTSWGLGQILGLYAQSAGYASATELVESMTRSEDQQLSAVATFVKGLH